jgi:acetolactate synthase I/III small subunit
MRHVISALVQNQPGVLSQISGMFSARDFNIDSLVVGRTESDDLSRMTIVVLGDDSVLQQAVKQLDKLVCVVEVADYKDAPSVERDLMLVRISAPQSQRADVVALVDLFRGRVVDIGHDTLVVELAGPESKIEAFIELARPHGILEASRTGVLAMTRELRNPRTAEPAVKKKAAKKTKKAKKR